MERIDKIIAASGAASRSQAKVLLKKGLVLVNGEVIKSSDFKVDPDTAQIALDGKPVIYQKYIYIMMNKPKGVLSASSDKRAKTVVDLLPEHLKRPGLFPVGRLDKDTTGFLLITDDGPLAHDLLSPKKKIPKTYYVELDGEITDQVIDGFGLGVTLADGQEVMPAELTRLNGDRSALVTIKEGKYHQIKRMFGVFSLGVVSLKRLSMAGLTLDDTLFPGEARELSGEELLLLKNTNN